MNWAAGIGPERTISGEEIEANLKTGSKIAENLLTDVLPKLE